MNKKILLLLLAILAMAVPSRAEWKSTDFYLTNDTWNKTEAYNNFLINDNGTYGIQLHESVNQGTGFIITSNGDRKDAIFAFTDNNNNTLTTSKNAKGWWKTSDWWFVFGQNIANPRIEYTQNNTSNEVVVKLFQPSYTDWYVNIQNSNGSNIVGKNVGSDGKISFTDVELGNGKFQVQCWDGFRDIYFNNATNVANKNWTEVKRNSSSANISISGSASGDKYNVQFDFTTNQIYVEKVGSPAPTYPSKLFIVGDLKDENWKISNPTGVTGNNGTYNFQNVDIVNKTEDTYGYFTFISATGDDWGVVNKSDRYGAQGTDVLISNGETKGMYINNNENNAGASKNWKILPGKYNITVNLSDMTVSVEKVDSSTTDPDPTPGGDESEFVPGIKSNQFYLNGAFDWKWDDYVTDDLFFYSVVGESNKYMFMVSQSKPIPSGKDFAISSKNGNPQYTGEYNGSRENLPNDLDFEAENVSTVERKVNKFNGDFWGLIIITVNGNNITGIRFIPGATSGSGSTDPGTGTISRIYFNAGADYYKWFEENGRQDRDIDAWFYINNEAEASKKETMTRDGWKKLSESNGQQSGFTPMFFANIPENATGVKFNVFGTDIVYDATKAPENVSTDWKKYIYGPGKNVAYQSYVTYEQYVELKANMDENGLYFLGQNLKISDNDRENAEYKPLKWVGNDNDAKSTNSPVQKVNKDSDGIYVVSMQYVDNSVPSESGINNSNYRNLPEFKVSFINPNDLYTDDNSIKMYRWYATYNLGIIGPSYFVYPSSSNGNSTSQKFEHIKTNADDKETDIKVAINTTMQYNFFNQFNWLVGSASSYTGRTLYLVIDTGDDFGTASLLNYNPRPTLSGTAGMMYRDALKEPVTVPADNHPGGYQATTTSDVVYALSNRVDVNFTCTPGPTSSDGVSSDKYTFVYELMNKVGDDYNKINEYSGEQGLTPFTKHIASMPIDNDKLYIRSTYTDNKYLSEEKQPLKFRSRVAPSTITTDINLTPLEYDGKTIIHFVPSYTHDGMMDIVLGIKYKFDSEHPFSYEGSGRQEATSDNGGAAVYPGFEITLCDRNQKPIASKIGYVIPSTYPYTNNTNVRNALLNGFVWDGDNTNDVNYKYGWATKSAMAYNDDSGVDSFEEGFLPIIVPDAFTKEKMPSSENKYSLKIVLYAVYPFTFDQSAFGSASSVNGRRRIQTSDGKEITTMEIDSEPAYIDLDGYNGTVSGIEDALIEVEGEGVLYNLQGVRVADAAPAPGVYLRRNSDGSASKVVIR